VYLIILYMCSLRNYNRFIITIDTNVSVRVYSNVPPGFVEYR